MSAKEAYPEILREFHRMVLLPHELVTLVSGSIVVLMLCPAPGENTTRCNSVSCCVNGDYANLSYVLPTV